MVLRPSAALLVAIILLAGCGKDIRSKEKVQEAILNRLQTKTGLDLKSLDVTTTSVSFNKNMAYATVAFHPKGDPSITSGMVMKYTLEDRDGKWVVVNVGDSQGHAGMGHTATGADQLPPGHPPTEQQLPPGHPRVDEAAPQQGASGRVQ